MTSGYIACCPSCCVVCMKCSTLFRGCVCQSVQLLFKFLYSIVNVYDEIQGTIISDSVQRDTCRDIHFAAVDLYLQ
jgi:hypothetical protein